MSKNKVLGLLALLVIFVVVAVATSVTLSPQEIAEMKNKARAVANSDDGKDMKGYIADIWSSKLVPEFDAKAIPIQQVIAGLKEDPDGYAQKHGVRNNDFSPMNFIVKGKVKVKEVNTKSKAGKIVLDIKDVSGKKDAVIQIGPVIQKSAIRDSLSFIDFNDFVNQIEFAKVSKEIKNYIRQNVVNNITENNLVGKEIEFEGAFTYDKGGKVLITPIKISVEDK